MNYLGTVIGPRNRIIHDEPYSLVLGVLTASFSTGGADIGEFEDKIEKENAVREIQRRSNLMTICQES
jgi:hypothetical protein